MGPKSGFRPRKFFCPNRSKNGRKMAKSCFLGLKRIPKVVLGPKFFFVPIGPKMAEIWQKLISRPKEGQNVQRVILSKKFFFGQIGEKFCFLGLKRVPKVVLGLEKNFVPIDPKMAEIGSKVVF